MAEPNWPGFVNRSTCGAGFLAGCEGHLISVSSIPLSVGLAVRTTDARLLRGVGSTTERQSVGAFEPSHAPGNSEGTASPTPQRAAGGVVGGPDRGPEPTITSPIRHCMTLPAIRVSEFAFKGLSSISMTSGFLGPVFQVLGAGLPSNERVRNASSGVTACATSSQLLSSSAEAKTHTAGIGGGVTGVARRLPVGACAVAT